MNGPRVPVYWAPAGTGPGDPADWCEVGYVSADPAPAAPTCEYVEGGPRSPMCGRPATVRTGWDADGCDSPYPTVGQSVMHYCAAHYADTVEATGGRGFAACGCVLLEVIDLTKADPGPDYADMLRSL